MRTLLLSLTVLFSLSGCGESEAEIQAREQAERREKLNAYNAQVQQKYKDSNDSIRVEAPWEKK